MLTGKVALVTGAARGIGKAIAIKLAQMGAMVVGVSRDVERAKNISLYFNELKLNGVGYAIDIANSEAIEDALTQIVNTYGAPAILINNAGITRDNLMLRMTEEEWDEVVANNLTPVFRLSKACIRDMIKARWGRIINITSVVAFTGNGGQVNYSASKGGITAFSKSLAQEVGSRNITVNCIAPGFIETDMTQQLSEQRREALLQTIPMRRSGSPEDVAKAVSFLVSDAADYITGQTIHVNGGMFMG